MENSILKIYISNTDRFGSELLYEHIVKQAKEFGIAGATVYRGIMGYGKSSQHISSSRFWELTEKLPVIIELIDETNLINLFCEKIKIDIIDSPKGCLISIQPIEILLHKSGKN